jgi:hypothetical protein
MQEEKDQPLREGGSFLFIVDSDRIYKFSSGLIGLIERRGTGLL